MNILLQSIKAISVISILSIATAYPMAWVKDAVMREGRRARWNFELVKSSLPNHASAYAAGAVAITGLAALVYNQYNSASASSMNNFASPVNLVAPEALPLLPASESGIHGADCFIIGHSQKVTAALTVAETPLHAAIRNGNVDEITQILSQLTTGAQRQMAINKNKNANGQSAIDLAADLRKFAVVRLLSAELTKPDNQ